LDKVGAYQWAIGILCGIAAICMYFPVFAIDEKKYTQSEPSAVPFKEALLMTFKNKDFLFFAISDFNYFLSLTILTTGLSYYITVLLFQEASLVSEILPVMLFSSFLCYPIVNFFAKKIGKKRLVLYGFFVFLLLFIFIYFMGGFGLGLYIVGLIVKAHGGKLLAKRGKSKGLEVICQLPVN
jgi:GPH family glycoside/pentoside/hexuronide:cation symporter